MQSRGLRDHRGIKRVQGEVNMTISILGPATRSVHQLNEWLKEKKCPQYADLFKEYGEKYGVRWDLVIFQACHETGFWRFGGDVKVEQNNFFGTGASGNGARGDSFATPAIGIEAHMQNMALRAGKKIPAEEILSPYVKKNYGIISNRFTTMWNQLSGTYAADLKYWEKIQIIMLDFDRWALGKEKAKNTDESITILELNRSDEGFPAVTAYSGETPKYTRFFKSIDDFWDFRMKFPNVSQMHVAETDKKIIPRLKDFSPVNPPKRVLLDPGHSEKRLGARGKSADVQEEDLNRYQAEVLKKELEALGIQADIFDPIEDDLWAIGKKAQGYDCFISLHLNAYSKKEHYTCCMVHPKYQAPTSMSAKIASRFANVVAAAIGNPVFSGSPGYPSGVMATGLSVLSGAANTNCPCFFLSELEFVDDETETAGIKLRIEKGLKAGAKVIADFLA